VIILPVSPFFRSEILRSAPDWSLTRQTRSDGLSDVTWQAPRNFRAHCLASASLVAGNSKPTIEKCETATAIVVRDGKQGPVPVTFQEGRRGK